MNFYTHRKNSPEVDPSAWVAPSAILVGDVRIGANARVLHGAVLNAEDGTVLVGERSLIMEGALIRGRMNHSAIIGSSVLIGPHTHVNGAVVEEQCFIATGASLFPGSSIGHGSEVRINGVVQVNTRLEPESIVPIGWIAVGNPARILSPERHDEIQSIQRTLDFIGTVYGTSRDTSLAEILVRQTDWYGEHRNDVQLS